MQDEDNKVNRKKKLSYEYYDNELIILLDKLASDEINNILI